MTTKAMGESGFRWFIGLVVDRKSDPLKLGRLKVRIYGVHDDSAQTPDNELPWATLVNPVQSASANQVGIAPVGVVEGTTVVGFFADGAEGQIPMILGTIAGIPNNDTSKHDVSKLAREENPITKELLGSEPQSAYNAKYPYNKVTQTESGHIIELDDTPANERIHVYHKSGTYTEINKDGRRVDKIVGNNYVIVANSNNVYIKGMNKIIIDDSSLIIVKGDCSIVSEEGSMKLKSKGNMTLESEGNITISGKKIDLNPSSPSTTTDPNVPEPPAPEPDPNTEQPPNFGSNLVRGVVTANRVPNRSVNAGYVSPNLTTTRTYGGTQ